MKKLLIISWALLILGILFGLDFWISLWRRDPFVTQPPKIYLHFLVGFLGIGSLLVLFRYTIGSDSKDLSVGVSLALIGLVVTMAPVLLFSIENLRGAAGLVSFRGLLWPAGVVVLWTGGLVIYEKTTALVNKVG